MFFSQDILQRRGGKFGIVWLAATKCKSVSPSRREYLTVRISKTCDDIVEYICLEAQPLRPHGARPRLSLYLSSQLMLGVARVYGKQMEYLSVEVHDLYLRYLTTKLTMQDFEGTDLTQMKLQKSSKTKELCTLQDPLNDEDSEFGVMRFSKRSDIDPSELPYIDFIQDLSPLLPLFVASDHSISPQLSRIDEMLQTSLHTVSSSSEITIQEIPEPSTLLIPGDNDLVLDDPVVDFMEQIQIATEAPQDPRMKESPRKKSRKLPDQVDGEKIRKVVDQTEEMVLPPLYSSPESTLGPLPTQLPVDIEEEAVIPPEPVTPTQPTQFPVLQLSPLLSPPDIIPSPARRRGRRRQLVFSDVVDDFTQLSKQYIRNNMATSNNLCYTVDEILPAVPALTTKELLELPGRRSVTKSATLMALWKRKAVPYKAPKGTSSDEVSTWSTDYLKVKPDKIVSSESLASPVSPQVRDPQQEIYEASPEQLRDVSVESASKRLRFEETPTSFIMSDVSRLSESRDSSQLSGLQMEPSAVRQKRRLTEQSIEEEGTGQVDEMLMMGVPDDIPPVSEAGDMEALQDIAEAISPEISTSEGEQIINIPHQNVIREIAKLTEVDETITFKDLVPIATSRRVVGKVFSVCLEYAALKLITLQQNLAYGDIYIKRGLLF